MMYVSLVTLLHVIFAVDCLERLIFEICNLSNGTLISTYPQSNRGLMFNGISKLLSHGAIVRKTDV